MRIEEDFKLDYKDVLMRPKRSTLTSRKDVDITREFIFLHSKKKWKGIPVVASNMDTTGTLEMAAALGKHQMITCLHKFYSLTDINNIANKPFFKHVAITSGIKDDDISNMKKIVKKTKAKFICLDVANGYTERFMTTVSKVREMFPDTTIIAGNVATGEMTEALILAGADIVKIGIGPGSACTTRKKAGVGYPQLSATIECADAAHGIGGRIMSDGGCNVPGDINKAFGGGADFVMLGGMLAAHAESDGKMVEENGEKYKLFYGMSSDTAMKKYYGMVDKYRASEGKTVRLKYRGNVDNTVQEIVGGLRSCCTYIGARRLKDVPKCTTFVRVTQQTNDVYSDESYNEGEPLA